jgi:putative transposase
VAEHREIELIHTPVEAPKANAVYERYIGSVRRELLDHILIISERHLYRKVKEYVNYFNGSRPHRGIGGQIPIPERTAPLIMPPISQLQRIPVLEGLHHD